MTLTDFLLARIAEDEAAARNIVGTIYWKKPGTGEAPADGEHIARWNPERVLADCEAKRRIVERERYRTTPGMPCAGHPGSYMPHGDYGEGYCMEPASRDGEASPSIRDLARIYADHPDYREEWKP